MRLIHLLAGLAALCASTLCPAAANATVFAKVDISSQAMSVFVDGKLTHTWRVSTGAKGFATPRGVFRPQRLARMHYSKKYFNAPMPHAIFINGGVAIHGTTSIRQLGRPASHGCVRLHPSNAAMLFSLVQKYGPSKTTVVVSN
jgi:lipoprotein-anchoring transpeptidase ErfK/SrfK